MWLCPSCVQTVAISLPCFLVSRMSRCVRFVICCVQKVSGVSFMWRCVRLVFWNTRLSPFFALLSDVSRLSRCARLVFYCVQTFAGCPLCFLVCPKTLGLSTLFSVVPRILRCVRLLSGVSRIYLCVHLVYWCIQNVVDYPPSFLVCPKFDGVRLVFWCDQTVAVYSPCFLVCPEWGGFLILFSGVSRRSLVVLLFSRCVHLWDDFLCVQDIVACPSYFLA